MKRGWILILTILWCPAFSQVGIGTTTPNARLEITASNTTSPSNSDGLLIPRVGTLSATNPTAAQHSMLVFLTSQDGFRLPGFYFWENTLLDWVKLSSGTDGNWINLDDILNPTGGSDIDVAIGLTTTNHIARLHILADYRYYGILNQVNTSGMGVTYGLYNIMNSEEIGTNYGVYNQFPQENLEQTGVHNAMANYGSEKTGMANYMYGIGTMYGIRNEITGNNFRGMYNNINSSGGFHYGMYSIFQPLSLSTHYGTYTQFMGAANENYGSYNLFEYSDAPLQVGQYNKFNFTSGGPKGVFNLFNGGAGDNVGVQNEMISASADSNIGVYNNIFSGYINYGIFNQLVSTNSAIGTYNLITGDGILAGSSTRIENANATDVYGHRVEITNSVLGSGNRYGFYSLIENGAEGDHYGIFSQALKPGSYSGYFVGNVRMDGEVTIGTDFPYTLPAIDGPAGATLQANGSGQALWTSGAVKPYTTTGAATGWYFVNETHYTVRAFNGITGLVLPTAMGNEGRIYILIGSNGIATKQLTSLGGIIYDDVTQAIITTISANQRYMVQSDGFDWIVIGN